MNITEIIAQEVLAIYKLPRESKALEEYDVACHLICYVKQYGGKVLTTGIGKAGLMAKLLASTLCSITVPATFIHPSEAMHGDLGAAQEKDLLIIFSNSGETEEIIAMSRQLKQIEPDISRICITSNVESTLALTSDVILSTGNPEEICPMGLTPSTSITAMTVMIDILIHFVTLQLCVTPVEYYERHHSGYLGQKAKQKIEGNEKPTS